MIFKDVSSVTFRANRREKKKQQQQIQLICMTLLYIIIMNDRQYGVRIGTLDSSALQSANRHSLVVIVKMQNIGADWIMQVNQFILPNSLTITDTLLTLTSVKCHIEKDVSKYRVLFHVS